MSKDKATWIQIEFVDYGTGYPCRPTAVGLLAKETDRFFILSAEVEDTLVEEGILKTLNDTVPVFYNKDHIIRATILPEAPELGIISYEE